MNNEAEYFDVKKLDKINVDEKDSWFPCLMLLFFIIMVVFSIVMLISHLSSGEKPDDTTAVNDIQKILSIIKRLTMILSSLSFASGGIKTLIYICTHDKEYGCRAAAHAVLGIICMGGAFLL